MKFLKGLLDFLKLAFVVSFGMGMGALLCEIKSENAHLWYLYFVFCAVYGIAIIVIEIIAMRRENSDFFKKHGIRIHEGSATKKPHGCITFTRITPDTPKPKPTAAIPIKFPDPDVNLVNQVALAVLCRAYPFQREIIEKVFNKHGFEMTGIILNTSVKKGVDTLIISDALKSKKEARKYGLQDYVKPKRRKP